MKERVKNWITTGFGIPITLVGLFMLYMKVRCFFDNSSVCEFSWMNVIQTLFIGWVLVVAKDSLITEGLLMGIFGIKKQ